MDGRAGDGAPRASNDDLPVVEADPAPTPPGRPPAGPATNWLRASGLRFYLVVAPLSFLCFAVMTRLWRANWSVPFFYEGDVISSAAHFKTVLATGWYENQPDLGVPYGQHYHDFPFSDDLHPLVIKLFGLFTGNWITVFNLYYVLGFPLAALTGLWFLRRCGVKGWLAVILAVLYSVAPYHFWRNEMHFFLGEYYAVPLGLGVALAAARSDPLWGNRTFTGRMHDWPGWSRRPLSALTGLGAGTVVCVALVTLDAAYYGVFAAVLIAGGGLFGFARRRNWARLGGVVTAGVVLGTVFLSAMLPDLLYQRAHPGGGALVRFPQEADVYSTKLAQLLLPTVGHPIPALAHLRAWYDATYPYPSEDTALGLIAAVGFLGLLVLPLARMASRRKSSRRETTLAALAVLTWVAFLACITGGLGTFLSFFTDSIRGWNRMSIFLSLLALAGLGLFLQRRFARWWVSPRLRALVPVCTVALLAVGLVDQASSRGIPPYATNAARWAADQAFFNDLQTKLPHGAMVFQAPYVAFPEAGLGNLDSNQLEPYLHTTTLKFSGGGFKGRPQIDWQQSVSDESAPQMARDLAVIGFSGILVDIQVTNDGGLSLDTDLTPVTGAPLVDSTGQFRFYSLAGIKARVDATLSPAERAAQAQAIDHIPN